MARVDPALTLSRSLACGAVTPKGECKIFELFNSGEWNVKPRICHLQWGTDKSPTADGKGVESVPVLYCISSDLLDKKAVNTLIRVRFDPT